MPAPGSMPGLKFGSATPPAIFPPMLGLFGLGLGWRQAAALGAPREIGELILGAVTLLYLFALASYATKFLRRPGVLAEDLRVLPGRGGIAAMLMALCVLAATLVPYDPGLARIVVILAIALQAGLVLYFLLLLGTWPPEQRRVTPVYHLIFVGVICAPLAAIPTGLVTASQIIFVASGFAAAAIWGVSLAQLLRGAPPPPLRPTLAIHLAPASLLGIVALRLGYDEIALGLAALGLLIGTALLARARFLTAAGFSALWGAFTFPLAALASLLLAIGAELGSTGAVWIGGAALVFATVLIPWIAYKIVQAWAKGGLAKASNAAVA